MPELGRSFEQIEKDLAGLFREILGVDEPELSGITKAYLGEQWSSLRHAELLIAVQKKFKLRLDYAEILRIQSYGTLRDVVLEKVSGKNAGSGN